MDSATADKVSRLAKSMKDLHLVATMEDGYQRAKEILLVARENEEISAKKIIEEIQKQQETENLEPINNDVGIELVEEQPKT